MAFVNMLDIVYPIGSVLETHSIISPSETIGGTWEEVVSMKSNLIEIPIDWEAQGLGEGMYPNPDNPNEPWNSLFIVQKGNVVMIRGWMAMRNFDLTSVNKEILVLKDIPKIDVIYDSKAGIRYSMNALITDEDYSIRCGIPSKSFAESHGTSRDRCLAIFGGFRGTPWASDYYDLMLQCTYTTSELPADTSKLGIHAWKRIG